MIHMTVLEQPYPARVHDMFWFRELRSAIAFLQQGGTLEKLKERSQKENFFNASSASRATGMLQVLSRRLSAVDAAFCAFFQASPLETQKLLALTLVLLTDHTFYRVMDDCWREKLIVGDTTLYNRDILEVLRNIQEEEEKAAKWTDASVKKIRANYKAILRDAGLITGNKEPYQMQKPLCSPALHGFFQQEGLGIIEKILTGERP